MEGLAISTLGGALGGALGTALMQQGAKHGGKLPESIRPPRLAHDPGDFLVSKAEQIGGGELSEPVHGGLAHGLHWAYGTGWGAALGLVAPTLGVESLGDAVLAGAALGAGVWAVGYLGWLPAAGLTDPVYRQGPGHLASSLLSHVLYGVVAALPMYGLARLLAPRRRRFLGLI